MSTPHESRSAAGPWDRFWVSGQLPESWGPFELLAFVVPLALYIATASGHGYWLDAGEFVAQGADFGISHPPGHPLAGLLLGACRLLPLGSLPFRVALGSAFFSALAVLFVFRAARRTFGALGLPAGVGHPLALGAAWWAAGAQGFWFQGLRPEVYGLQAALVAFALERLCILEAKLPEVDFRPFYQGIFALSLALANHHFLALLVLPVGAATLARLLLAHGAGTSLRPFWLRVSGFSLLGLGTYIYLPLRSLAEASLRLGQPESLRNFWWVVSAEVFQKNTGAGVPGSWSDRLGDVLLLLGRDLHPATLVFAGIGLYFLLRLPRTRRLGLLWLLVVVVFTGARLWLGFVRGNPDAAGYLMPATAALSVLAFATPAALLAFALGLGDGFGDGIAPARRIAVLLAALLLAGGASWQFARSAEGTSLAAFRQTDAIDDAARRSLPSRAIVLAFDPQTIFAHWGAEATEANRPDTLVVPMPMLAYPGMVESLVAEEPGLRPLLRGYLLEQRLRVPDLQTLAAQRSVLIEVDFANEPLWSTLTPDGLYHRVISDGATRGDRREGARDQRRRYYRLYTRLGTLDRQTRERLLWRHYLDALFFASQGERCEALDATQLARKHSREEPLLEALEEELSVRDEQGECLRTPLDIAPYRADNAGALSLR